MSAFIMSIFKATAGLLVDKARAKTAEMLKDGDVADEAFRRLIVSKIDEIKNDLRGLARKDLLSSITFLRKGIVNLNQVIEKPRIKEETENSRIGACATDRSAQAASLVTEAIRDFKFTDLSESAKALLADAVDRFRSARINATEAFSNDALSTSERILALKIQLMATILERVDRAAQAVEECKQCLEDLHDMKAVQENFRIHFKGNRAIRVFGKQDRDDIIVAVCQANYVVFRVMQVVHDGKGDALSLPDLKVGLERVHVLRDERVVSKLIELEMTEFCGGVWSLCQELKSGKKLKRPFRLTTNTRGEFIVADESRSRRMKVYDSGGKFVKSICFNLDDIRTIHSLATDRNNNVYVLADESANVQLAMSPKMTQCRDLYVFNKHGTLLKQRAFTLTKCFIGTSVAVSGKSKERGEQVFILGGDTSGKKFYVEVYDALEGELIRSFGQEKLKEHPTDIAAADDGRVFVLMAHTSACVHAFGAEGEHLHTFPLQGGCCSEGSIALGWGNRLTVVVSLWGRHCTKKEEVSIYTGNGDFVRDVLLFDDEKGEVAGHKEARDVAVTVNGRIAVLTSTPAGIFCKISQEHDVHWVGKDME